MYLLCIIAHFTSRIAQLIRVSVILQMHVVVYGYIAHCSSVERHDFSTRAMRVTGTGGGTYL